MGWRHPHMPSEYPSFALFLLDKTHVTVTALTTLAVLLTRDAHVAWFGLGALGSSLFAKAIKPLLRAPRPPPPPPSSSARSPVRPKRTYGMPSTHATALSFFVFYLVPLLLSPSSSTTSLASSGSGSLRSPHTRPRLALTSHTPLAPLLGLNTPGTPARLLTAGAVGAYWAGGVWSRVELGYHTWPQVAVGAGVGGALAALWKMAWDQLVSRGWEGPLQGAIDTVWRTGLEVLRIA